MDLPFAAEVEERDALFVPAGFDTPAKQEALVQGSNLLGPQGEPVLFEEII